MEIITTKIELDKALQKHRSNGDSIGFVPTMGALHQGHLSLIHRAKSESDIVVCSIFVNPTQFNDPNDLIKYPRPIEKDIELLISESCDYLFLPEVTEMYSENETWEFELGNLETIFEGAMRPGHFQGVTQIVHKLFDAVKPDKAFFGQKDIQQCKVIEFMIQKFAMPIHLIICPIEREKNGLAMSSRNVRLSEVGKEQALALYRSLKSTADQIDHTLIINDHIQADLLINQAIEILNNSPGIRLEYFSITESKELKTVEIVEKNHEYVILVAAWVDGIRLIDNLVINTKK